MAVAVDDAAITEQAKRVQEDGFTIVEGAADPALTATVREALRSLANQLGVEPKATAAGGIATKRKYNLLAKEPLMAMALKANVLPIVERVLDGGCLLSAYRDAEARRAAR